MNIREAQIEDIETLFNIRTSVIENHQSREELVTLGITPETVAEMLQTDCRAWIAEIDEQPIAFSMANGAGRALMQQAEQWLWSQGVEEIWLLTGNDSNLRAYGFYLHLGWTPVDIEPDGQIKFLKKKV
jgi:N-acetylglutamate synthase-like GNAT family acetyltransferase